MQTPEQSLGHFAKLDCHFLGQCMMGSSSTGMRRSDDDCRAILERLHWHVHPPSLYTSPSGRPVRLCPRPSSSFTDQRYNVRLGAAAARRIALICAITLRQTQSTRGVMWT